MRFGLLIPCYVDAFFPEVGIATLELPERPAIKPAAASQWLIAASTRIALLPRPCSSAIFPASITPWPYRGVACITSPASLLAAFKVSLEVFEVSLEVMGGDFLDPPASGDGLAPVRAKIANAKVVCSAVPEIAVNRDLSTVGFPVEVLTPKGNTVEVRVTELRPRGEFATWRAARAVGDHDLNSFFVCADALEANEKLQPGNDGVASRQEEPPPNESSGCPAWHA